MFSNVQSIIWDVAKFRYILIGLSTKNPNVYKAFEIRIAHVGNPLIPKGIEEVDDRYLQT